jgi:tRNA G46 methylase TrmB
MARVRRRKSYNPYRFQRKVEQPNWSELLDLSKPVEVDLGFGRGEFIMEMALRRPEAQFVGIEIRAYLVEKLRDQLQVRSGNAEPCLHPFSRSMDQAQETP